MKRKECAIVQSRITKLEEECTDLNERNKLLKEIRRLNQSLKPALTTNNPTELGGCATLPDIHRRGAQVLRVHDSQISRGQIQPSLWARDSHSTPSLPSIDTARQRPVPSYAQDRAVFCGQGGTKASHLTSKCTCKYRLFSINSFLWSLCGIWRSVCVCKCMHINRCFVFWISDKRVKSLTNTIERKPDCSQRKKDASLSNLRRRNVPLGGGRSQNAIYW